MSAPPTSWISNSNYNKFKGSYINGDVDLSNNLIVRNGNVYLPANAKIYTPANSITFNDTTLQTIITNNLTVSGISTLTGSATFTSTAGFNNGIVLVNFPSANVSLTNTKLGYLQDVTSNIQAQFTNCAKTNETNAFSLSQTFQQNIRMDTGSLIVNSNGTTLTNATLNKIQYLSNVTTDISGSLTTLQTNINTTNTNISTNYVDKSTIQTITALKKMTDFQINGVLYLNAGALTITQANLQNIQYLSNVTTDISGSLTTLQNNINAINPSTLLSTANTWIDNQTLNKNLYLKSSLYIAGDFNVGPVFSTSTSISNATLQKIQYLSNITTDISGSLTTLQNNINAINTSANSWSSLQTFNGNIFFPANGTIGSASNTISFNDTYGFTNFLNNIHVYGTQQLDYGGTNYNVGYEIVNTRTLLTNISYNSSTNTTTVGGNLTISGYVDTTNNQTIDGIKTFSSPPVLSGASITASTIPNSALATSYVPASGASTIAGVKTFSSAPVMSGASITSATIPNAALAAGVCFLATNQTLTGTKTFQVAPTLSAGLTAGATSISNTLLGYLSGATANLQGQLDGCAKLASANTLSGVNTITNNLIANSQTITPTQLGYLSGATSNLQTQISAISTSNFVSLTLDQTVAGLKTFSSVLTAGAGLIAYSLTSASNLALTTANTFTTYINSSKTSGDFRINTSSPNSNTYVDNGIVFVNSPTTGTNLLISQPNSTQAGIYSGSLNNATATDYCEGMYLLNNGYGAEIQGGRVGTTTDVCNLGFHNNGSTINFLSAQNTTGSPQNNSVSITGQVSISGSLSLNGNYGILSYNPIGTIIHNCSASIGLPLLLCNGQTISRTTYASLFAVIGTVYGSGDGSTTFQIPNYSGAFLRGMGSQTPATITYASDANPATYQADQMRSHTHSGQSGSYLNTGTSAQTTNGYAPIATTRPTSSTFATTGGVNSGGNGAETRPFNFGIYMYIRAL